MTVLYQCAPANPPIALRLQSWPIVGWVAWSLAVALHAL